MVDEVPGVSSPSGPGQPGTAGVSSPASSAPLALSTPGGRWLIVAAALGSGVAFLDGSVVNVALPAIGRELGGGFSVLQLQQSLGYTATAAGLSFLPFTVIMLLLSSRVGAVAQRIGPRWPMTIGPLVAGGGLALLVRAVPGASYLSGVLPGIAVFGLGMALTVAPLTSAVMASVDEQHVGTASGVNNAVSRIASLLAVAVLPLAVGLDNTGTGPPRTRIRSRDAHLRRAVRPRRHHRPSHHQAANTSSAPHPARPHPAMPAGLHPHTTTHQPTPSALTPSKIVHPAPDGNPQTAQTSTSPKHTDALANCRGDPGIANRIPMILSPSRRYVQRSAHFL